MNKKECLTTESKMGEKLNYKNCRYLDKENKCSINKGNNFCTDIDNEYYYYHQFQQFKKENEKYEKWRPIISRLVCKCKSHERAKGICSTTYLENLHKENLKLQQQFKEAKEIIKELVDCLEDLSYKPDSFTMQPAIRFLQSLESRGKYGKKE